MNLTTLIRKGHLAPVTTRDKHGITMLTGWKRKASSRKRGAWTLKKPTVWIDRLAVMQGKALMPGAQIVRDERERQINREGWTTAHDDSHVDGELIAAANCYVTAPEGREMVDAVIQINTARGCADPDQFCDRKVKIPKDWPWSGEWWKPSEDRIRDLAKAGALYLAEADRLRRADKSDEAAEVEKLATGCMKLIDERYGV